MFYAPYNQMKRSGHIVLGLSDCLVIYPRVVNFDQYKLQHSYLACLFLRSGTFKWPWPCDLRWPCWGHNFVVFFFTNHVLFLISYDPVLFHTWSKLLLGRHEITAFIMLFGLQWNAFRTFINNIQIIFWFYTYIMSL